MPSTKTKTIVASAVVAFIALAILTTTYPSYRRVGCVPVCPSRWKNISGNCFQNCPSGWTDQGLLCRGRNSKNQFSTRPKKSMKPQCPDGATGATQAPEVQTSPLPTEGMSVSCQGDGKVYRYTGGILRHYPDPPTARAWNPEWATNILAAIGGRVCWHCRGASDDDAGG